MKSRRFFLAAAAAAILFTPLAARSQGAPDQPPPPDPLAPFERLVGGQWQLDGSYQEFEWGVGRRSVKARSYFVVEGKPRLVSEGVWFWHPGEMQIKGTVTAVDMPVVFFDYTTRFEGNRMVNELRSYAPKGERTDYVETWDFTDQTHLRLEAPAEEARRVEGRDGRHLHQEVGGDDWLVSARTLSIHLSKDARDTIAPEEPGCRWLMVGRQPGPKIPATLEIRGRRTPPGRKCDDSL